MPDLRPLGRAKLLEGGGRLWAGDRLATFGFRLNLDGGGRRRLLRAVVRCTADTIGRRDERDTPVVGARRIRCADLPDLIP